MTIDFHADDFGLFEEQSRRILQCHTEGALNGISVITNGECLEKCLEMIRPIEKELTVTVHLNFLQGRSICPQESVSLLTDEKGRFNISFSKLLIVSFSRKKNDYKEQLKKEIKAQIFALKPFMDETGRRFRIDGHAHWHMIPVVFDALMEVIREENLDVEYIRLPDEPVRVLLKQLRTILPFHPVNIIKTIVLKILVAGNRKKYREELSRMEQRVFTGVLLSGDFSYKKAAALIPVLSAYAGSRKEGVELLAHPGAVEEPGDLEKVTNRQDAAFFTDPARKEEARMFQTIYTVQE